ncbi:choice-of-anchor J domain-containing protein [Vibrio sp. HN007]|uniref:choice-of-anchor J domain-containing protein n=1 Tax=Vibrio iocasae TaxID=3098914 RepID=UPI0035D49B08
MNKRILALLVAGACHQAYAASDLPRLAWVDDPSSTVTIGWRQLSGTEAKVTYGPTEDKSKWTYHYADRTTSMQHPDDAKGTTLDTTFAEIKGLKPDTAYYFQICDSEGCSETSWFKTAPAEAGDFTFVAGGDSRTNQTPRQDGNKLVSKIRPLFVLFNGDYTDNGTHDEWVTWLEDWQYSRSEDGRVYPIVAIHGNHENDVIDMTREVFGIPEEGYFTLNVGGEMMEIFALNSETEPGVGYGAYSDQTSAAWDSQTSQFAKDAASSTADWKIGTYHRPMRPHTSGKTEGTGRIDAWAKTFTDNNFDLLIESDTHMTKYTFPVVVSDKEGSYQSFKRDDARGAMIIGEGSWGAPTRPTDDDKPWTMDSASFWQFKLVHASPDNMRIRTVRFGSEEEAAAGINIDTSSVTALTQDQQDENAFAMPAGLPLWAPLSGSYIDLPKTGFIGANIDNKQLVGTGSIWKYLDDGSSPADWTTEEFNDSKWAKGYAQFGYGDGDEKTEVSFGGDADKKHATTYFRNSFTVADASKVIKLTLRLLRDDGAVVYINGKEAVRSNMPSGDVTSATFATSGIGGAAEKTYYEYPLFADLLKDGKNTIAVEVHQSGLTSSDLSFDMDLTAVVSNIKGEVPAELATTVQATAKSTSEIDITWSDEESFNEVGYQLERKVADGNWEILTWRLEADATSFGDSMLTEGVSYSYRVRPYSAAGLAPVSEEVTVTTLSNEVPKLFEERFDSESFGAITMFDAASDKSWVVKPYNGNASAYMNGYGASTPSDDWMILPALPLSYYANKTLEFDPAYNYDGPLIEVKYSTDYDAAKNVDPSSATWTTIPVCENGETGFCWEEPSVNQYTFEPTMVDLSSVSGDNVTIAFNYISTGTGGGDGRGWRVDNIVVRGNYVGSTIVGSDLSAGVPSDWTNYNVASTANWEAGTQADRNGAIINGFGADTASEDWLIFPGAELSADDMASVRFDYYQKYGGPMLKVMVSTDYTDGKDPSTATWTDLGVEFPALHGDWMSMGPVSLAGYEGNVHVAFLYTSKGVGPGDGARIGIANAEIQRNIEGVVQQTTLAEEEFNTVGAFGTFSTFNVASNAEWVIEERGGELAAVANGFGADAASDDWLISPQLFILNWQNAQISFDLYWKYGGPELEVLISTDYDGKSDPTSSDFNWTVLKVDQSEATLPAETWTNYLVDVSSFSGKAYVAFRYTSIGTGGGEGRRWGVDNFKQLSTFGKTK